MEGLRSGSNCFAVGGGLQKARTGQPAACACRGFRAPANPREGYNEISAGLSAGLQDSPAGERSWQKKEVGGTTSSAPRQYGDSVDIAVQTAEAAICVWFRLQFAVGRWCWMGHVDVACSLRSPVC